MLVVVDNSVTRFLVDLLRNTATKPSAFQRITNELSYILAYEACKDAATKKKTIQTWQGSFEATSLPQDDVAIVPVLRAGLGKLGAVLLTIPAAVLGGIMILLFGMIASVGIRTLIAASPDMNKTRNLIIISVILTIGVGGAVIDWGSFSIAGIGLASVVGVFLHQVLPKK